MPPPQARRLLDRVAIVTGAAGGIGHATAARLAAEGSRVLLVDIDEAHGAELTGALQAQGADVAFHQADVTDSDQSNGMVRAALEAFGRLDILVNNAGGAIRKPAVDYSADEWRAMIDLNLSSVFYSARHAYPFLRATRGCIVNIGSVHATFTVPGMSGYAAAKGGLLTLTRSLALEFAPEVRVNTVVPALVETELWLRAIEHSDAVREKRRAQHPLKRLAQADDIAAAVAFLAGDDASFITGTALPVDGGLTLHLYHE